MRTFEYSRVYWELIDPISKMQSLLVRDAEVALSIMFEHYEATGEFISTSFVVPPEHYDNTDEEFSKFANDLVNYFDGFELRKLELDGAPYFTFFFVDSVFSCSYFINSNSSHLFFFSKVD